MDLHLPAAQRAEPTELRLLTRVPHLEDDDAAVATAGEVIVEDRDAAPRGFDEGVETVVRLARRGALGRDGVHEVATWVRHVTEFYERRSARSEPGPRSGPVTGRAGGDGRGRRGWPRAESSTMSRRKNSETGQSVTTRTLRRIVGSA